MMQDPVALLNDHAHLEKKAATNALDMLSRWPTSPPPKTWIKSMVAIAKDETDHLYTVVSYLESLGGSLTKHHKNTYANDLHRTCVRVGEGPLEHVDRLLVSAMIELRSCERFKVLGEAAEKLGLSKLQKLYQGLWASEQGHFNIFLAMAYELHPRHDVEARWQWVVAQEKDIIARQPLAIAVHSGPVAKR